MAFPVLGFPAWAQEQPPQDTSAQGSAPSGALPDVTVTGRRGPAASTQSTLSSTGRVTGAQAEDLGLRDLREALRTQANVMSAATNNGNTGITIRGINSEGVGEPGANSRPLTTLVIDGAPQSIEGVRRGQRGAWDIDGIEVLRGPQSTLQGRNTLAGSISIKTADPTDTWEGAARLTVGEQSVVGPAVMLSGPLSEEWAFRFAAETATGNKDIRYSAPSASHLDDDSYRSARIKLRYKPLALPGWSFKLSMSYTMDDPSVTAITVRNAAAVARNDGCPETLSISDRYFCVSETAAERRRNQVRNTVLDVQYQVSPGVRWESVTARVETDARIAGTGSFGGPNMAYFRDEVRSDRDISQLVRFVHDEDGARWSGEAGVFLGRFDNDRDSLVKGGPLIQQNLTSERRDESAAVFAEARWRFHPGWRAVAGVRYEEERSRQQADYISDGERDSASYKGHATSPKVALIREFDNKDTLAFSVSTGYRGGFREVESFNDGKDVAPEFLTSYDLAYRSKWLDGKLTLGANVFHNRWRDQQVSVNLASLQSGSSGSSGSGSLLTTTLNAGRSEMTGGELEWAWRLARSITWGGSLGLLKTRFIDFPYGGINLRGNEFPEAPRMSGAVWLQARFGGGWMVAGKVDGRSSAFATSDIYNNDENRTPGYAIAGMTLGYEAEHWDAKLYVDNLFDRAYLTGRDFRNGAYVGDARRVQFTVTTRF
ncbi:MAG: TonB-dependent receptor [Pseudomonadota bacterium]